MCTVNVKVDEELIRGIYPELGSTAAIRKWTQELVDKRISEIVQERDYNNYAKWDITKTKGYQEALDDVAEGRVYEAASVGEMIKQILG